MVTTLTAAECTFRHPLLRLQVDGQVTYNGKTYRDFNAARTAAYVYQGDNHIAQMTTRETLDFSARCQGVGRWAGARPMFTYLSR